MKLKTFQRQDLARAALKDGLILGWDTGLGKTWAMFVWPLLKVGFDRPPQPSTLNPQPSARLRPRLPVLIVAPGDLHQQIREEAFTHFGVVVQPLDSQQTFEQLTRLPGSRLTHTDETGRPIVPPGFYITSYTQLTTNGVAPVPDPEDWEPCALLDWLAMPIGVHRAPVEPSGTPMPPCADVCTFFAWRAVRWADEFDALHASPRTTIQELDATLQQRLDSLRHWDEKAAAAQRKRLLAAHAVLVNLCGRTPDTRFADLSRRQQDWIVRAFCADKILEYSAGMGELKAYPIGEPPPGYDPAKPETDTRPKRYVKCLYSPSLADLCWSAFDCVVVDEGVKMKGETTIVGRGVRSLNPRFRLVLTATPVKNRLPDAFRLAWWAVGGKAEATPIFPYRDESSERERFASTFMVTERNLSKEEQAKADGKKATGSRFRKYTAEVCNVHRLWKLFGPIILRRRKQDAGEDIVPKVRKVIRCQMGTLQKKVYQYHLDAEYRDVNGKLAVGAQLQALRIAAADPSSDHLKPQPGEPEETCPCRSLNSQPSTLNPSPCPVCRGRGSVPLPPRSTNPYVPKAATVLTLIAEILERREQAVVFSAFNDPLDNFSHWLSEADVRHVLLDGRVSQKSRGDQAAIFKQGRRNDASIPVMLAGVECMAEGHSFHLANNVILMAYSWAYDKFKQALDRVHRMNSVKPVNVYVVVCPGTIDLRLESLVQEKADASELVLDGRLIGERTEEVNLAELLHVARREFNAREATIDEDALRSQWPALRQRLHHAWRQWIDLPAAVARPVRLAPEFITIRPPAMLPSNLRGSALPSAIGYRRSAISSAPDRHDPLAAFTVEALQTPAPPPDPPDPAPPLWKLRARARFATVTNSDVWSSL
ncbi:MAG TPA: DEAD/DEAH box helicase [Candidatus Acidoferrum sp.]|nr:DEAD/DEAH box helicase [Candidatus Acidoferrum sp.]